MQEFETRVDFLGERCTWQGWRLNLKQVGVPGTKWSVHVSS